MHLIIITGLSGSGKSTAARALEDDGFFVVDNLPQSLLPTFLEMSGQATADPQNLAVVIDARNRAFLAGFEDNLATLAAAGHQVDICFFDASDETLIRRYSETRRRHPLAQDDGVSDGIRRERLLLAPLRNLATRIIDSTGLTPHQLRAQAQRLVLGEQAGTPLVVHLQSFGFRYGIPIGSDLVMDVRFLPNPHFLGELRPLSGLDAPVAAYLSAQSTYLEFLQKFQELLQFLLPQYQREGKSYLTISIGCTGGRHRSVAVVDRLREFLAAAGVVLNVVHRDIDKG